MHLTAIIGTVLTAACNAILKTLSFFFFFLYSLGNKPSRRKKNAEHFHVCFILYDGFASVIIMSGSALLKILLLYFIYK